jgi:hypothetical protein
VCFQILKGNNVAFLLALVLFLGHTLPENISKDTVLARVGSKEITVKEFLERSELTIRPQNFKDKYTTLNNLILEKILALEAEKNSEVLEKPAFKGILKGLKEQSMRDSLYHEIAFNKIKLEPAELRAAYKASLREYELEFYVLKNKVFADDIEAVLDTVPGISGEVFKELGTTIGERPVRKVTFKDKDDDAIHEALFSEPIDTGVVVGPLKLTNGTYILMKVLNWVDYPIIGGIEQAEQWEKAKQTMHGVKARKLWRTFQTKLMGGKRLEFNKETFNTLADAAMEYYISKTESDSLYISTSENPLLKSSVEPDAPFLSIDNNLWTADDFRKELLVHPLVFRTKDINRDNFKEQFRLAVVDMIRDYYLTQEAYKISLDKLDEIDKTVNTWKDYLSATSEMNRVIKSALSQGIITRENNLGMLRYKESYLMNLQKEYGSIVTINTEELERISLTKVDFLAVRPGVPFPNAVPGFPVLFRSGNLDYAKQQ